MTEPLKGQLINFTIFAASSKLSTANIWRSLVVKIAFASSTRVPVKIDGIYVNTVYYHLLTEMT